MPLCTYHAVLSEARLRRCNTWLLTWYLSYNVCTNSFMSHLFSSENNFLIYMNRQSIMTEIQFDDGYIFCVKCSLQRLRCWRLSTLLGELFQEVLETLGSATLLEITKCRFWGVGVGVMLSLTPLLLPSFVILACSEVNSHLSPQTTATCVLTKFMRPNQC